MMTAIRTPERGPTPLWRRGSPGDVVVKAKPYGRPTAGLDNGSVKAGVQVSVYAEEKSPRVYRGDTPK
jgi:hypothetical protein